MQIKHISQFSETILQALNQLIPELLPTAHILSIEALKEIIESPNSHLLVAQEDDNIIGCLTLVVYPIPTGKRAWIEDVVVSEKHRGEGAGKLLVQSAIELATKIGADNINLTSNPARLEANALYKSTGFVERQTNVYRHSNKLNG